MLRGELSIAEECRGLESIILLLTRLAFIAEQGLMSMHGLHQEDQAHVCFATVLGKPSPYSRA